MATNVVAPDGLGGLERYVRELATARVRMGDRVTVIAKRPEQGAATAIDDGIDVRYYDPPRKSDPLFALKYASTVRAGTRNALNDVLAESRGERVAVHGHYPVPALGLRSVPYLETCHGMVHLEMLPERAGSYRLGAGLRSIAQAGMRRAEVRVFRRAKTVITVSEHMRGLIRELAGPSVEVVVIPCGIDTTRFSPDPARRPAPGPPLLVTARRLVSGKGVAELVRAMPAVIARHPGTRLVVAGDGPLRPELQRGIESLGLSGAVTLAGTLGDDALVDLYRSATLAITPTQQLEPFGLSTAEALASGTPVLVAPSGGGPEVLRRMSDRFVSSDATPAGLAASITDVLGDDELMATARAQARVQVHPELSWPVIAERHTALYESVSFIA